MNYLLYIDNQNRELFLLQETLSQYHPSEIYGTKIKIVGNRVEFLLDFHKIEHSRSLVKLPLDLLITIGLIQENKLKELEKKEGFYLYIDDIHEEKIYSEYHLYFYERKQEFFLLQHEIKNKALINNKIYYEQRYGRHFKFVSNYLEVESGFVLAPPLSEVTKVPLDLMVIAGLISVEDIVKLGGQYAFKPLRKDKKEEIYSTFLELSPTDQNLNESNTMSEAVPSDEDLAQSLNTQGYQLLMEGNAEAAVDFFQRALNLTPGKAVILNNLGNALFNLNRPTEAQAAYQQAIEANSDYPKPYCNLALLYHTQNNIDAAIPLYQHYLTLVPHDGQAHHNLGLLYMAQNKQSEAITEFQAAVEHLSQDDPESTTNLGVGYFFRGDRTMAIELFQQALIMNPSFLPARYHLGIAYLYEGNIPGAIKALQIVIDADPNYPQAATNLQVAQGMADNLEHED